MSGIFGWVRRGPRMRAAAAGLVCVLGVWGQGVLAEETAHDEMQMGSVATATFAGGCFWCMEQPFDQVDGVTDTTVGYTGGPEADPTYQEVASGKTGHAESIQVQYDPSRVTYEQLLEVFWRNIDPTAKDRQFADVGRQYRSEIFYHDEEQRRLAVQSKTQLEQSGKFDQPVVTEITPASAFYRAEEYHQEYYNKNPIRYKLYRIGSGRDGFLKRVWGKKAKVPGGG